MRDGKKDFFGAFATVATVGTGVFNILNNSNNNTGKTGEIYRIWFINDPTHKCYIGQTVQGSYTRIRQHIADAENMNQNSGGCPLLDAATRKYGIDNMRYEILQRGITTHEELDAAEKYWIKKENTQYPNGYNVKSGGQGNTENFSFTPIDTPKHESTLATLINVIANSSTGTQRKEDAKSMLARIVSKIIH